MEVTTTAKLLSSTYILQDQRKLDTEGPYIEKLMFKSVLGRTLDVLSEAALIFVCM